MNLNKKGFAISVILYAMVILIMGIMYLLLNVLNTRYKMSKTVKEDVVEYINNQGINDVSLDYENKKATKVVINSGYTFYTNNNYYYYGSDPNNYVYFNSEIWRIIGIIEINNIKYTKIIRNESLNTEYTLNNYKIINSNLFDYLNGDYYNTLSINSKNLIYNAPWINAEYSPNMTPNNALEEELASNNKITRYIGLISGSDFGYAAGSEYTNNKLENYSASISRNWLALDSDYFTMNYAGIKINIAASGNISNTDTLKAAVYPAIYLKSNVLIVSGDGSLDSPYNLSLTL